MMEELLASFPELKLQSGKGTVMCSLSGHEMPSRPEIVRAYVAGKKFRTLKAKKDYNFQKLEPYVIPSQRRRRQLFCALTNRYVNMKPTEVELHVQGRRYKQALERYNAGQLSLFVEKQRKKKTINCGEEGDDDLEVVMEGEVGGEEGKGEGEGEDDHIDPELTTPSQIMKGAEKRARKRKPVTKLHPPLPTKQPRSKMKRRNDLKLR